MKGKPIFSSQRASQSLSETRDVFSGGLLSTGTPLTQSLFQARPQDDGFRVKLFQ